MKTRLQATYAVLVWSAWAVAVLRMAEPELRAQTAASALPTDRASIIVLQGEIEIYRQGVRPGVSTTTTNFLNPGDGLLVKPDARVRLLLSDQSVLTLGPSTEIELLPRQATSGVFLIRGILSFFHRDKPARIRMISRSGSAFVKGTEFVMAYGITNDHERATLYVIDGRVDLTNALGSLELTNGRSATMDLGQLPVPSGTGFIVNNVLQWALYYPGVLDWQDLALDAPQREPLARSLSAYQAGDLLRALAHYPTNRQNVSESERIYVAALRLGLGQVGQTEELLEQLSPDEPAGRHQRLANALRRLIGAVKGQPSSVALNPELATEFLALSYDAQSRAAGDDSLRQALAAARKAVELSPEFGLGWARVAELEFSFGRTGKSLEALNRSLSLSPSNAPALALKGFVMAAQNRATDAVTWFDRAIAVDPAMANAWLGRGLCRFRRGDAKGGREDLLVAAALEPQRALLRSYLGKAYAETKDSMRAFYELGLARQLDPQDPTAWLYAALLNRDENKLNAAIADLESSVALNDNRAIYRSELLLDQDRAVRGTSLARIYRDTGMSEVSFREASRAVTYDYANYSAHLFLSESYGALHDPNRINLRYEAAWRSELLIANLLAPVGAGSLSSFINQNEYSRLFEMDQLHLSGLTEYTSLGDFRQVASQFGTIDKTAYSIDLEYLQRQGHRANNDLQRLEWITQVKHQLTEKDSVWLNIKVQEAEHGDVFQYLDENSALRHARVTESQEPSVLAGYHRAWQPNIHTLFLTGRLLDKQTVEVTHEEFRSFHVELGPTGYLGTNLVGNLDYRNRVEFYPMEFKQILQNEWLSTMVGGRLFVGNFEAVNDIQILDALGLVGTDTNLLAHTETNVLQRIEENAFGASGYVYETLRVWESVSLTLGLAYDWMRYPSHYRNPPITPGISEVDQLSPKAGIIWNPVTNLHLRGFYSRSLGGITFDESTQLEPTQLAGFTQTYRSILSESLAGSIAGTQFEVAGAGVDWRSLSGTYLGLQAELLNSRDDRHVGAYASVASDPNDINQPTSLREKLSYKERAFSAIYNQRLQESWALGCAYRVTQSELETRFPAGLPPSQAFSPTLHQQTEALLHQVTTQLRFNHPSGLFAIGEGVGYWQRFEHSWADPALQLNIYVGFRLKRQRGDITLGGINLTGDDYRLHPLTPYADLPRQPAFYARVRFTF